MPEFRKDSIVDRWVILAPDRAARPQHIVSPDVFRDPADCPFCEGHESETPAEVLAFREPGTASNQPGWHVRIVPNRYPAIETSETGGHEVIVESPRHVSRADELDDAEWGRVFRAVRDRIFFWRQMSGVRYVQFFKNSGDAAGATLPHAHSQLLALPLIPTVVAEELAAADRHFSRHSRCILCSFIERERTAGSRIVFDDDRFVAICPPASRFPLETWVLPTSHAGRFEEADDDVLDELGGRMRMLLARIESHPQGGAYNYYLHTTPFDRSGPDHYHWHVEVTPRRAKIAGFELAGGMHINTLPPEQAAARLRNAAPSPPRN